MLICLNAVAECGQSEREEMENCMMELSAGNTAAMEPLYRIANPSVYAFALSLLKNSHDAEEIAQECFVRAYLGAAGYRPQGKPMEHFPRIVGRSVTLSALSISGKIILPMMKNEKQKKTIQKNMQNRNHLIAAARDGDEDAIENLTLEDMDTYSMLSRRIAYEDVLSIVDTCFMPYGVESDQYSVIGEILDYKKTVNKITEEEIYIMKIDTNGLVYDVCINKEDLLGEPQIGRRFKGNIWMQGCIRYMN